MSWHVVNVELIRRLVAGENLSTVDAQTLFSSLDQRMVEDNCDDYDDYYLTAIVALMAKGPNSEELRGIVDDIAERSIDLTAELKDFGPLVDISGTGGDLIDTPNVGSLASFVSAAGGVAVAKQATSSFTGVTGSADVFKVLGLDVYACDVGQIVALLRETKVTAMHTPSHSGGRFARRLALLRRLRDVDLRFVTPWHLVSWVYSPFPLTGRIYGVSDGRYLGPVADVLGARQPDEHSLVVHGEDGLDEISVSGSTRVIEIRDGRRDEFCVSPDSLGLPTFSVSEVSVYTGEDSERLQSRQVGHETRAEIRERARCDLSSQVHAILSGRGHPAHNALIAANAGAALYVGGRVDSLAEGASTALEFLLNGAAQATASAFSEACDGVADPLRGEAPHGG